MSGIIAFAVGEYHDVVSEQKIKFLFRMQKPKKMKDSTFIKITERYLKGKDNRKLRYEVGGGKSKVNYLNYSENEIESYIVDELRKGVVYVRRNKGTS